MLLQALTRDLMLFGVVLCYVVLCDIVLTCVYSSFCSKTLVLKGERSMSEIMRPLTVRVNTRQFSRLAHEEVLTSIENVVDPATVKAIQITENTCYVTVDSNDVKEDILMAGLNIRGTYNNVYDVEKILTNVTIKDAPYELSDYFLIEHMRKFGDVVENSLRRGKIRGTEIETGTRYVQLTNCKEAIPIQTSFGRFKIRIFSDNKTECRVCGETGHPFFRCPRKETERKCFRCKSPSHLTKDCLNEIVCHHCQEKGHKQSECEEYVKYKDRQQYGRYAEEILEGRKADKDQERARLLDDVRMTLNFSHTAIDTDVDNENNISQSISETNNIKDNEMSDNIDNDSDKNDIGTKNNENGNNDNLIDVDKEDARSQQLQEISRKDQDTARQTPNPVHVVLGDSNATRVHFKDPDVFNISQSGASAAAIDTLLSRAISKTTNKTVKRVAMHLGTVDVSRHKSDANQVIVEVSSALTNVNKQFPQAEIAFSSIPQRRGKSAAIVSMNKTADTVNEYIRKLVPKQPHLRFLNNDEDLLDKGIPVKALYDTNDASGVHLSNKGAEILEENIQTFFDSGLTTESLYETPFSKKRNRSVLSGTPPSDKHAPKVNKA